MAKRTGRMKIEPHQGSLETSCGFSAAANFIANNPRAHLQTNTGTEFTAVAAESVGRKVIRFFQAGREYARAYECCWGHYYNCNRTRIGMYCRALDAAAKAWFERKVSGIGADVEKLPADRQDQLKREMELEVDREQ